MLMAAARRGADPPLPRRVGELHVVAGGQPMAGGHEQVLRLVEQRALLEPRVVQRRRALGGDDQGDVGLAGKQQTERLLRLGLDDAHLAALGPQPPAGRGEQPGHRRGEAA